MIFINIIRRVNIILKNILDIIIFKHCYSIRIRCTILLFFGLIKSYNDHSSIISRRELQLFLVMITSTTIIQCYMRTRSVLTSLVSLSLQLLFLSLSLFLLSSLFVCFIPLSPLYLSSLFSLSLFLSLSFSHCLFFVFFSITSVLSLSFYVSAVGLADLRYEILHFHVTTDRAVLLKNLNTVSMIFKVQDTCYLNLNM